MCRSTLADANETRPYQMYEALFITLYQQCAIQAPEHRFRFRNKLYSFDASVIDLCLSVFPWAKFRTTKGAIKLHALLDHDGHIPSFVRVTTGSTHDIHQARHLVLEPDSIVAFDRGYVDYAWFYSSTSSRRSSSPDSSGARLSASWHAGILRHFPGSRPIRRSGLRAVKRTASRSICDASGTSIPLRAIATSSSRTFLR